MNNVQNHRELRLNYIIPIVISLIGLASYIIFDYFSIIRTTFWPNIVFKAMAELFFSWSIITIILVFLIYIFLEGLRFTENDFLKKLSNHSSEYYNLGFELTFLIIPLVIFLIIFIWIVFFSQYDIYGILLLLLFLIIAITLYLYLVANALIGNSFKKRLKLLMIFIFLVITCPIFVDIMQFITTDVDINFDQNYYRPNDYVLITIDKIGIPPPRNIEINPNNVYLKSSEINETEQITSNQGVKKVIIYRINNSLDFGNLNYKTVEVDINYEVEDYFFSLKLNKTKAASFIILK